jgi:hypothetical protein
LLSTDQSNVNASIPLDNGSKNRELNLCNFLLVAAILLKCGRCRYIVEMRTLPLYCRNADVAAILLKCGRCRYFVDAALINLK